MGRLAEATAASAVGKNFDFAKSYSVTGSSSEKFFLALVEVVATLAKEIVEAYENVQDNKKTCGALVNRVAAAEFAIQALMRQKEENFQNFCRQDYYNSFLRFVNCLKQIKKLFDDISHLSKFKKFVSSGNIRDNFERIIKEFNACSGDLNLAISIATNEQMNKDLAILSDDMFEMMKVRYACII